MALRFEPYMVIVANESRRTVVAYATMWESRDAQGHTNTSRSHSKCPDAVCGTLLSRTGADEGSHPTQREVVAGNGVVMASPASSTTRVPAVCRQKDRELSHAVNLRIELDAVS